jgi:hypothetical protein
MITPFIASYNIKEDLKKLTNNFNYIDNLWLSDNNLDTFKYSFIDIVLFFSKWKENKIDQMHIEI